MNPFIEPKLKIVIIYFTFKFVLADARRKTHMLKINGFDNIMI